jgi:hypothetical protein
MGIAFTSRLDGGILFVDASGFDDSLDDVKLYASGVIDLCLHSGTDLILCDETGVDYRLGTFDLYDLGSYFSSNVPFSARVAIVCKPDFFSETVFFENVVVNRGHVLKIFKDSESAKQWLLFPEKEDDAEKAGT